MKMSFRWYGEGNDPIPLEYVRQIPSVTEVVWALHHKLPGEVWQENEIREALDYIESYGLSGHVVESVNVHEDIKLGLPSRDEWIENYKESLKNLGKHGVDVVCYNFMPIFDWTRTDMFHELPDGSTSLFFEKKVVDEINPDALFELVGDTNGYTMPGWEPERMGKIQELFEQYKGFTEEKLLANFTYFMEKIGPVCTEYGIRMAIHPDDPAFPIFGLPRMTNNKENLRKILAAVDQPYNGLTVCTGSLGSSAENDMVDIIHEFKDRIYFMHVRNVKRFPNGDFSEVSHRSEDGDVNIAAVIEALHDVGFTGYIRPDHGRHIFGENQTNCRPGYGLYDRALGIMYINGCWDALNLPARSSSQ